MKLNILVMAHLAPPRHNAGAETMLLSLLRPLADRGHKVDWVLSREVPDPEPYDLNGITVHPHRDKNDPIPFLNEADVVISHLENMPRATLLARSVGIPFAHVMHNDFDHSRAWAVADAAVLAINSEWMFEAFGCPANGVIVRPSVFAEDYRLPEGTKRGKKITLANLNENKGGHLFADLARRMPDQEFLAVIGAHGDQLTDELESLSNVTIHEHTADMRAIFAQTKALLMPSKYESWGRVGTEAMCAGIPVIANPTPGLVENLGDAGIFVDREDPAAWVAAIRKTISPKTYPAESRRALARAAELEHIKDADLELWVERIERAGAVGRAVRSRRAA